MYSRFDEILRQRNIKASDVSRATGISSSTFTDWKKGRYTPKYDKLQKIADYFDVPLEYLTDEESDEKKVLGRDSTISDTFVQATFTA